MSEGYRREVAGAVQVAMRGSERLTKLPKLARKFSEAAFAFKANPGKNSKSTGSRRDIPNTKFYRRDGIPAARASPR